MDSSQYGRILKLYVNISFADFFIFFIYLFLRTKCFDKLHAIIILNSLSEASCLGQYSTTSLTKGVSRNDLIDRFAFCECVIDIIARTNDTSSDFVRIRKRNRPAAFV